MTYIPRFAIHNFIINFLFNYMLAGAIAESFLMSRFYILYDNYFNLYSIVEIIVKLFLTIIIYMFSVKWSAHYASKGDMVPDYERMKKFLIVYFGVIAVAESVTGVRGIFESFPRDFVTDGAYSVFYILRGVCIPGMIPYTLKVYKADIARDKISVERSNTQEKVSMIAKKRKRNLAIVGVLLVLFTVYWIYNDRLILWEEAILKRLNLEYDFENNPEIIEIKRDGRNILCRLKTTDENQIEFDVKAYWGRESLPWGETIFIERTFMDDFEKCILEYAFEDKVYDVSGKSEEEIVEIIKEKYAPVEELYKYYDVLGAPDVIFTFEYDGYVAEIPYCNQEYNNNRLEYDIRNDLISPAKKQRE